MKKVKIYLADDHAILREGLRLILNESPDLEIVGEAGDGPLHEGRGVDVPEDSVAKD